MIVICHLLLLLLKTAKHSAFAFFGCLFLGFEELRI